MSEWKDGKLSDIALITMGQSPQGETCNTSGDGVPLLNGPTEFGIRFPTPLQFTVDPKKTCEIGDILFCVRGSTTGRMNWANQQFAIGRGLASIRHKKGNAYQYYLKGVLDFYLPILLQSATGSTFPNVSGAELNQLEISIPNQDEQKSISEILSSLDDKIDLLHRQNRTLEQLAEILFRQWFVEDVEEGWEEKSLVEVAEYLNGLALQKFPANGIDSLPVIKIREMKQGISENTDRCAREIPDKYIIHDGDILFSWSGSLEVMIWSGGDGALNQHLFKVSSKDFPKWYYYLATKLHLENFKTIAESKSTTMGHIQREHLSEAKVTIPPKTIFDNHDKVIAPLIEKLINNNSQISILKRLRETLLPKLMSGEVRMEK